MIPSRRRPLSLTTHRCLTPEVQTLDSIDLVPDAEAQELTGAVIASSTAGDDVGGSFDGDFDSTFYGDSASDCFVGLDLGEAGTCGCSVCVCMGAWLAATC